MSGHWHLGVDHVLIYGISAIVVINVLRLIAAGMVSAGGNWEAPGKVLGALVHFGS
jgi:hypothetical protein